MRNPHPAFKNFEVLDGCLSIGGIPVTRLVERAGGTPCYIYDRARIRSRVEDLRRALPKRISLHYAIKANPMPAVVQLLANAVDGFDVASAGEMLTVLDTGTAPENISFAGPGKNDGELSQAIAAGIVLHAESMNELLRIEQIGKAQARRPTVAVRVNPDFELKASGMRMGGGPQQFGIDAEAMPAVFADLKDMELEFVGLHVFAGSQNLNAESLISTFERTLDLAGRLADMAPAPIRQLNVGGGFGIPYFPKDQPLDLAEIGKGYADAVAKMPAVLAETELIMELGRYLVGEAGIYVARVIDRKVSRGQVFLIVDGGLNHHLAATGNFGQVIRRNYPVAIADKIIGADSETETVSVVGPLCTPLDTLADRIDLPPAEVGDLAVVLQSGAYGASASPSAFLSHPPVTEILV